MDPFTKKILDRAEKRSRQLGISDTSKFPLSEFSSRDDTGFGESTSNTTAATSASPRRSSTKTPDNSSNGKNVVRFSSKKPPLTEDNQQQYDNISVEINITTDSNVGVKCDVISMDVDEDGNVVKKQELINDEGKAIRDVSRTRLQRLGALYSNTENLSSPIHRTEGKFCADSSSSLSERETPRSTASKSSKLAALADSYSKWECDEQHSKANPASVAKPSTSGGNPRTPTKFRSIAAIPVNKTPERTPTIVGAQSKGAIKKTPTSAQKTGVGAQAGGSGASPKPKSLKWDKSVMDALESQGFQNRQSQGGSITLTYDKTGRQRFGASSSSDNTAGGASGPAHDSSSDREKENRMNESMSNKKMALASNKDTGVKNSPKKLNLATTPVLAARHSMANRKDPAELSLRDRLAIFEKNKGTAILPKAPLSQAIPANKANPSNNLSGRNCGGPLSTAASATKTPEKQKIVPVNVPKATSDAPGLGIQSTISALMQGGSTISGQSISASVKKQREQEMDLLLNRFNRKQEAIDETEEEEEEEVVYKIPAPPPPPPTNYATNKRRSGESGEEPKRPKTQQANRLYPNLSEVEDTSSSEQNYTTATVSEDNNKEEEDYDYSDDSYDDHHLTTESVARKVLDSINKSNRDKIQFKEQEEVSMTSTDEESDGMDDYLDEALENNTSSESRDANRRSVSSNSFSYSRAARESKRRSSQHSKQPVESKMTLHEDENEVKLIHTVSFYRRQQTATVANSSSNSPSRAMRKEAAARYDSEEDDCMESDSVQDDPAATQKKIKQLLDEVCKQQQIIGQTSQALNLCASTVEFSGSTEAVEGERHLLVATHRRQAALNEIQRLRVEGLSGGRGMGNGGAEDGVEKGKITITDITLPLRQDYIRKLSADTISGHNLVCLVKYGEHVFATRTVPTLPGLLTVKFPDTIALPEVYSDFKITLEIYGMTAQREVLPHDIKYHISKGDNKKNFLLTPKGKKSAMDANRLVMPPVQSPGGPNAVRTPGLVHYGFVIFSMKEVRRTNWTLNTVTSTSPLDGTVHMKIDCELSITVTHAGFLTMFEEVSGFGAWHRRWCRLQGQLLSFWKYPDDERKKTPIGTIDLSNCIGQVVVAPRDICARLNTLMLELKQESTKSRHLLSSDTKEERDMWRTQFNRSITLMNSWSSK